MLKVILSDRAYIAGGGSVPGNVSENDVYPLVKAFYPEETVKVYSEEESPAIGDSSGEERRHPGCHGEENEHSVSRVPGEVFRPGAGIDLIKICFWSGEIGISLTGKNGGCLEEHQPVPEGLSKAEYKNSMKRFLYRMLSKETGRSLPWGILTGIRPTKLVYEMLKQGETEHGIYEQMRREYLCTDGKIARSLEIAGREMVLLDALEYQRGYSIYIGIPFCPSTCLYCSFPSYSVTKYAGTVEKYLEALEKEISAFADAFPERELQTVYLGGGTPTTLDAEQLDRLLGRVKEFYDFSGVREFCVEAGRPDSITPEKLKVLKKWGVNRISINPQSMSQKTLDLIGRKHTVEQVEEAFLLAREAGHDNINMDIIIGLPGEDPEDVANTLRRIRELNPDSLTVHTLAVKRAARLNLEKEAYSDCPAVQVSRMLEQTEEYAKKNGYVPYYLYRQKNMADNLENVGYARPGREGIYNILIMEEKQTILAFGAGGMSKFIFPEENRLERVDNVKSITDYIGRIDELIEKKKNFIEENRSKLS